TPWMGKTPLNSGRHTFRLSVLGRSSMRSGRCVIARSDGSRRGFRLDCQRFGCAGRHCRGAGGRVVVTTYRYDYLRSGGNNYETALTTRNFQSRFGIVVYIFLLCVSGACFAGSDVVQHHKNASRDGVYVDSALTHARAATMHLDKSFAGTLTGSV